ncbi:hypothetical protein JSQ81_15470 [Sporosarcina sp. Marseille-Q4063]|uniref:hypothetical protein n=1 Tax=Sporosarcina sp. Marseille-Q4063 TaxID=2810514 RepID=UPI001BB01BD7|nr:hypothetical protein [Sporosarcina sp. Marseille-Q4063]QUW21194.1 hypothetical protein JSQ81_15470 [Sporosarcina sp. Marseille-Q4063]
METTKVDAETTKEASQTTKAILETTIEYFQTTNIAPQKGNRSALFVEAGTNYEGNTYRFVQILQRLQITKSSRQND